MGAPVKKTLSEEISENLHDFRLFVHNAEEGTILGRNGSGWGK